VSVTRFIIYLLEVPICWRSNSQKGVTIFSTEAKYVAISEAVKEVGFVYYLFCDPIVVRTDNIRTIFMPENELTCVCTWHVDTRFHFFREFIEVVYQE
jgi:hypothetical protein